MKWYNFMCVKKKTLIIALNYIIFLKNILLILAYHYLYYVRYAC
jgi:hypothetical protein